MKLASRKNNTRDGELIVVNKNLTLAISVPEIALTLQSALDDWQQIKPQLEEVYQRLNNHEINGFKFDVNQLTAPLPRAYQWADGSAYVNHVELVRKARGATMPEDFWTDPLMYQGGSDKLLGPADGIEVADLSCGVDFEAEVAIITMDVEMGISPQQAKNKICLFTLVNDVSLRNLIPKELAKGFGFFQSKPASAFAPVVVTVDELGDAWDGERLHLPLYSYRNNDLFGKPNAGVDMTFSFPELIAHAAKTRYLGAGTIIGSGTVSNTDRSQGSSCIAEKRMLEMIEFGEPKTEFLHYGETVRIEMLDKQGKCIFGSIHQEVVKP